MSSDCVPVFFHLMTTGFTDRDHIIQIAATTIHGDKKFCRFLVPLRSIPLRVTESTGFTKFRGELYQHGKIKATTPFTRTLKDFVDYLQSFNKPVILIANNAFAFHCRFILKCFRFRRNVLRKFSDVVQGFCDSLPLVRRYLPGMKSYSLEALVSKFVSPNLAMHDAANVVAGLAGVFKANKFSLKQILEFTRLFEDAVEKERERRVAKAKFRSLEPLQAFVSEYILKKMSKSGLDLGTLQQCLHRGGPAALEEYLSQTVDHGLPRVTRNTQILKDISQGLQKIF